MAVLRARWMIDRVSSIGDMRAVDADVAGEVRAKPKGTKRGPGFFIVIDTPVAGEMGEHFRVLSTGGVVC